MSLAARIARLERLAFPDEADAEEVFRELACDLYGQDDSIVWSEHELRELVVTTYDGAYGIAGYVIAVNGSPPRGTFITGAYQAVVYMTAGGRSRRLGPNQTVIVWDFLRKRGFAYL